MTADNNKDLYKPLTKKEKSMLWSQITSSIGVEKSGATKPLFTQTILGLFRFKVVLTVFLVVALVTSSAATVFASNSALPGDVLFPLDIAVEKIQLVFSRGNKKNTLRIIFAEERLKEVQSVIATAEEHEIITATTTPTTQQEKKYSSARVKKAEKALLVARAHLEKEKRNLEKLGNDGAVAVIDDIIAELNAIAETHVQELHTILEQSTSTPGAEDFAIVVDVSFREVKAKFKFEEKFKEKEEKKKKKEEKKLRKFFEKAEDEDENDDEHEEKSDDEEKNNKNDDHDDDDDEDKDYKKNKKHEKRARSKVLICHTPSGDSERAHTLRVTKVAARAHIAHGDVLGSCNEDKGDRDDDQEDNDDDEKDENDTATTTPDITAPIISNLSVLVDMTTAEINWNTDENTITKVRYATTSPIDVSSESFVRSNIFTTNHTISLTGLTASTTYYIVVVSEDASGNTATSSEQLFKTLPEVLPEPEDITPPFISDISVTSTTTSATVTWITDEIAISTVRYSTTTPIIITPETLSVTNTSPTLSHSLELSGLTASTTYYYLVSSTDESDNSATSIEYSLVTLP